MNYLFPKIMHINDVLPAIKDCPEFIVAEKDGYQVVNYVVMAPETFPPVYRATSTANWYSDGNDFDRDAAIRRECRGLVFDLHGKLINRRYHKFFNVNEREETLIADIDWSQPHSILEKLDGSMVSPCYVNGTIRWMTKMGITDTSMEAEVFVATHPDYTEMANYYLSHDMTPVFEWCSNKNRIVLDYPEDRLILTAIRNNHNGSYVDHFTLVDIAARYGINVVKAWDSTMDYAPVTLTAMIREAEGTEGVVVRFWDGHMVKIKSDWYVKIHKVKSLLSQERDVVSLILNNALDDLMPVLSKEDVEKINLFAGRVLLRIDQSSRDLADDVYSYSSAMDRKTFAIEHAPKIDSLYRGMIFQFWDKECNSSLTYKAIVDMILKHCSNNQSYAKVKETFLKDIDYA
jgi:T4 RnlA family RNA ligase